MGVPETPPRLLPGPSAGQWNERSSRAITAAIVSVGLMPVASLLGEPPRDVALLVALIGALGAATVIFWSGVMQYQTMKRERDAGYTTLGYPSEASLWRLDPKTGAVVLRPGEQPTQARRGTKESQRPGALDASTAAGAAGRELGRSSPDPVPAGTRSSPPPLQARPDPRARLRVVLPAILLVGVGLALRAGVALGPLAALAVVGLVIAAVVIAAYLSTLPLER
jgi:hypothetical protein